MLLKIANSSIKIVYDFILIVSKYNRLTWETDEPQVETLKAETFKTLVLEESD
jgi:hypothetical protein